MLLNKGIVKDLLFIFMYLMLKFEQIEMKLHLDQELQINSKFRIENCVQ